MIRETIRRKGTRVKNSCSQMVDSFASIKSHLVTNFIKWCLKAVIIFIIDQITVMTIHKLLLAAVWPLMFTCCCAQPPSSSRTVAYDSVLAKKAGADARGMKRYVVGFLVNGPV